MCRENSVNRGWNCIDTASNYRDSRAERSVGAALNALFSGKVGITRDMILVRWAALPLRLCALLLLCNYLTGETSHNPEPQDTPPGVTEEILCAKAATNTS